MIRELKKNVLTFCLDKVLIKCRVSIRKSSMWFYIDSSGNGVKVGPGPQDLGLRDSGIRPSKFKSGNPGPPSKFKSGTFIVFLHCLTDFVLDKYVYIMEIIFHE